MMFLALRELRRGAVRFALLAFAIGLLLFLVLFQQALRDGLVTAFVGAIRNQDAPVLVYGQDAQRTLQGSVITPPVEEAVRAVPGVERAARLYQGTYTVTIGADDADVDAALVGSDDATLGQPRDLSAGRRPAAAGEAVGSDADFAVGDTVAVTARAGDPVSLTVVGLAADVQLSVVPTLFTDVATYEAAFGAVNPEAAGLLPSALALAPSAELTPADLAQRVTDAVPDADAVTQAVAADTTPGVDQVRRSFQLIFVLYGLVVPLVTGLFFLIVTLQKSRPLTLLRAIGARPGVLARSLVLQVLIVTVGGVVLGTALYSVVARGRVGGLTLRYDGRAVWWWSGLFVGLALLGALASLRRVLRVDPIEATTGGGGR